MQRSLPPLQKAAANIHIAEALACQVFARQEVSAVNDERPFHDITHTGPVHFTEFFPFSQEQNRLRSSGSRIGITATHKFWNLTARICGSLRIVGSYFRALGKQALDDSDRRSVAHIVGIWLECQSPHRNLFSPQHPKLLPNFFHEAAHSLQVDLLCFSQQRKVTTELLRDADKRLQVLWKAEAPEADSGLQECRANSSVKSDPFCHFGNVGTRGLAQVSYKVDEGDFHGQERVGGVLHQLSAVDVGH